MSEEKTPGITIVPEKVLDLLTTANEPEPSASSDRLSDRVAKAAAKVANDDPSLESTGYNIKDQGGKTATAEEPASSPDEPVKPKKAAKEATGSQDEPADDKHSDDEPLNDRSEKGYKMTITRERNRRRTVEEANAALQEQLRQTLALAEKYMPKTKAGDLPEPKYEDFPNPMDYYEAKADWKADQIVQKRLQEQESDRQAKEMKKLQDAHQERLEASAEKYPDIEDIAKDPTLPVNDAMGAFIIKSKNGPDILWWLNENRDEAKRLYKMDPVEAIAELGEIRAKLAAPVEKKASKAPAPIDPVGANNSVKKDILNGSSDAYWADYERRRKEQVASLKTVIVR